MAHKQKTKGRQNVNAICWDNHVCLPFNHNLDYYFKELYRHKLAGFSVVSVNIGYANIPWGKQINIAHKLKKLIESNRDKFFQISSVQELIFAKNTGKLGIFFDVEGANLLEGELSRIRTLYEVGVRWMCLTYNQTNSLVGGCLPDEKDEGLSELGHQVVHKMGEVGMMVCCSHTGEISAKEIIEHNKKPTIYSHSNCKSVYNHWRNISDENIKLCGSKNGVVCINGVGPFLGDTKANVAGFMNHLEHLLKLVGPDNVGIGLDYVYDAEDLGELLNEEKEILGGDDYAPDNFSFISPEKITYIKNKLKQKGFSDIDINKIFGGNLLRVAKEVWV